MRVDAELARPSAAPVGATIGTGAPAWPDADSMETLGDQLVSLDPFRVTHRPSPIAFGAASQLAAVQGPSRPQLHLTGLIGEGTHWLAVIGGIPGRSGDVLLAEGDTIAGLRVIRIERTTATIRGADTSWTLSIRRGS